MNNKKTAEDLLKELSANSEFLEKECERKSSRERLERELSIAEHDLVCELRAAGVAVDSVWDLLKIDNGGYGENVIRVLLSHVYKSYPDRIREGILRALAVPNAMVFWDDLIDLYEKDLLKLPEELSDLPALILGSIANDSVIDDIIRLTRDKSKAWNRLPLLLALQRSRDPKAKMFLNELRADPLIAREIKRIRRIKRNVEN